MVRLKTISNGQKIGRSQPAFSKINLQVECGKGNGFFNILMGREFEPDVYAVLLDLGNKNKFNVKNSLRVG